MTASNATRLSVIAGLLAVVGLGCSVESVPLIGTWEYGFYHGGVGFYVTNTIEFRVDGTVIVDPQIGETFQGTWTLDGDQLTVVWDDGSGSTSTIEFIDNDTIHETYEDGSDRELNRV